MILLLLFMILYQSVHLLAVQFTYTPSPNIGVHQLAHYQCSVNHTKVSIRWIVNGTDSDNEAIIKLGIATSGAGSINSSLRIPGYPQYNNTVVTCIASGLLDVTDPNSLYYNLDNSTLRIQGQLAAVNNLICHVQSQYINCSWSPPFSLVSIPGYIINVTYGGELVTQNIKSSTTWQYNYCPSRFGTYTISVAGNNSAGEGEVSTTSVVVPEDNITECDIIPKCLSNNTFSVKYIIKTIYSLKPSSISINLTNNASTSVFYGNVSLNGNKFMGNVDINMIRKKKWNVTIILRYNCRTLEDKSKIFSTFDVQKGNLTVDNLTTGKVCFTCHFVERSQAIGCYVEYKCLRTDFNGNITIMRTSNVSIATDCVTGIYTSNYNVTFYDMDYNNKIYLEEYAVKLTDRLETGLSSPLSIPTSISTTATSLDSSLPTPCTGCTSKQEDGPAEIIIGVSVSSVLFVIILVAIIVDVVIILYRVKTKNSKQISSQDNKDNGESKMLTIVQINQLKYTEVTPVPNGPIPAADLHSTVPYSTVAHETSIAEQYSLVQQYQSSYSVNEPSNEEYARLNHNVHASTQLYDRTQHPHSHTSTPIPPMYSTLPTNGNMTSYISSPDSQYSTLSNKTSDKLTIKKTELTHQDLVTYVAPYVTTKLREIGTALVLTPSELNDIEENHQGITGVFQLWYETKRRPYTWDTLLTILRSPLVNKSELANKLTQ